MGIMRLDNEKVTVNGVSSLTIAGRDNTIVLSGDQPNSIDDNGEIKKNQLTNDNSNKNNTNANHSNHSNHSIHNHVNYYSQNVNLMRQAGIHNQVIDYITKKLSNSTRLEALNNRLSNIQIERLDLLNKINLHSDKMGTPYNNDVNKYITNYLQDSDINSKGNLEIN